MALASLRCSLLALVLCLFVAPGCTDTGGGGDDDDVADAAPDLPDADPAAPDAGGSGGGPGSAGFLDSCPVGDECTAGLTCFNFNAKGPHCSHACSSAADCEAPSPGCNGMGICKVP